MDADVPDTLQALLAILYRHNLSRLDEVKVAGRKFAHYTTAENALNIIAGRSVWLRNAAVMNDHSEIEHGDAVVRSTLEGAVGQRLWRALDDVHDGISNTVRARFFDDANYAREMTFMTSLCEHEHIDWLGRLSMWRAYGGARGGVALVFKPEVLTDPSLNLGLYPSPVLYGDATEFTVELSAAVDELEAQPGLLAAIDDLSVANMVAGALHFAMLSLKHRGFEEEREWRILCPTRELGPDATVRRLVRSIGGTPQLVYEVPFHGNGDAFLPQLRWDNMLDRIIIGPAQHPDVIRRAIEAELRSQGVALWDQLVCVSDIPLRQPG